MLTSFVERAARKPLRGKVGLPFQLCMVEQLPLWSGFFKSLGFEVVLGDSCSASLREIGGFKICYFARLMISQIEGLLNKGADFIFLPCEAYDVKDYYTVDEQRCSVLAYGPEIFKVINGRLTEENFRAPYLDVKEKKKNLRKLCAVLSDYEISKKEIKRALESGNSQLNEYRLAVKKRAKTLLYKARQSKKRIALIAGRTYFISEITGKDFSSSVALLTEDCISCDDNVSDSRIYRERLFCAARFCLENPDVSFVHLVAKGCETDEMISEELRAVLKKHGRAYDRIEVGEDKTDDAVSTELKKILNEK